MTHAREFGVLMMNVRSLQITSVVALLVVTACGVTDLERDTEAPIQTSRLEYVLREIREGDALATKIPFRYHNQTATAICITHCSGAYGIVLHKLTPSGWRQVWSPVIPACLTKPPITIEPDDSFRDTLQVLHGVRENLHPKLDVGEFEGTYRIDIPAAAHCGADRLAPENRVSNPFRLERQ